MAGLADISASIDALTSKISDEIDRVTKSLAAVKTTDTTAQTQIDAIVARLNTLGTQLDSVDASAVASGTPATIGTTASAPASGAAPTA